MAPYSSTLAWKIPWRRKWHPTSVLLPGKSHGWRRLVGYSPWGRKESDATERLHFTSLVHSNDDNEGIFFWIIIWNSQIKMYLLFQSIAVIDPLWLVRTFSSWRLNSEKPLLISRQQKLSSFLVSSCTEDEITQVFSCPWFSLIYSYSEGQRNASSSGCVVDVMHG